MPGAHIDLRKIEEHVWKENYLLLLGFPQPPPVVRGYVPLRVIARELEYFMYDPFEEGQISAKVPAGSGVNGATDLGFVKPAMPGSQNLTGKPFNAFRVTDNSHLYQMFMGVAPSVTRIFMEFPATVGQKNLDVDSWASSKLQFGWFDGFDSPLLEPSPQGKIVIPPQIDIAWGYGNPSMEAIDPLLLFVLNRVQVAVVQDVSLVEKMLDGRIKTAIETIGGLTQYTYPVDQIYGITPLPLGADAATIQASIGGSAESGTGVTYPQGGGQHQPPLIRQAARAVRGA
jgi:hypothetical protein